MSKVLPLSRWKKDPQPDRESFSDDEDTSDEEEDTDKDLAVVIPKRKRKMASDPEGSARAKAKKKKPKKPSIRIPKKNPRVLKRSALPTSAPKPFKRPRLKPPQVSDIPSKKLH